MYKMEIINFSDHDSIINRYLAEIRDVQYQGNRLLFRNNIQRIGEFEAFEISKTLSYEEKTITTPLGKSTINLPTNDIVLATILRAGLPFHNGFMKVFDHADNAFVSAYRKYKNTEQSEVDIHIEYLATPGLDNKTLIIADPMLATGGSMELGYKALITKGIPEHVHVCSVIATPEGIERVKATFPESNTTIWCAAIDPGMNEHKYIIPGFGDAGDLCFGCKTD
jgi:uracil phosphoribosyltransferase